MKIRVKVLLLVMALMLLLCFLSGCSGAYDVADNINGNINAALDGVRGTITTQMLSGSMSPAIEAGEIVVCKKRTAEDVIELGDVILFTVDGQDSTVLHRVVGIINDKDGNPQYVTKGDNNNVEDSELVPDENVIGIWQKK